MDCKLCNQGVEQVGFIDMGDGAICCQCLNDLPARLEATSLELATTEELVAELMRRETFRGVVAWQRESYKGPLLEDWEWRANHCNPAMAFGELAEKTKGN